MAAIVETQFLVRSFDAVRSLPAIAGVPVRLQVKLRCDGMIDPGDGATGGYSSAG